MVSCPRSVITGAMGLCLVAVVAGSPACGGKAVVDPPRADGGGGASTSNATSTSSSTGEGAGTSSSVSNVTSSSSGCDCTADNDCPLIDDGCFEFRCDGCNCIEQPSPPGTPCLAGVCNGGFECVECLSAMDCPSGECINQSCTNDDVLIVCAELCTAFEACGAVGPECAMACPFELGDCSAAELGQVQQCTALLQPSCNIDPAINCLFGIGCFDNG